MLIFGNMAEKRICAERTGVDRGQDFRPRPRPRKIQLVKTEAEDNRGFFFLTEAEAEAEECKF